MIPDIAKILSEYVSTLSQTIHFNNVIDQGDGTFKIETCNTGTLRPPKCLEIGSSTYVITELVQNEYFVVSGSEPITATSYEIQAPFFIHGTPMNAANELVKVDYTVKYPLIYLYEIYSEDIKVNKADPSAYSANVRLFFMDETNPEDYLTADHYSEVIRPIRSLVELFLDPIIEGYSPYFLQQTSDFSMIPWVDFGKFEDGKGSRQYIFKEFVSGYELKINLDVLRGYVQSLKCFKNC